MRQQACRGGMIDAVLLLHTTSELQHTTSAITAPASNQAATTAEPKEKWLHSSVCLDGFTALIYKLHRGSLQSVIWTTPSRASS
jgi:hypothetical protein